MVISDSPLWWWLLWTSSETPGGGTAAPPWSPWQQQENWALGTLDNSCCYTLSATSLWIHDSPVSHEASQNSSGVGWGSHTLCLSLPNSDPPHPPCLRSPHALPDRLLRCFVILLLRMMADGWSPYILVYYLPFTCCEVYQSFHDSDISIPHILYGNLLHNWWHRCASEINLTSLCAKRKNPELFLNLGQKKEEQNVTLQPFIKFTEIITGWLMDQAANKTFICWKVIFLILFKDMCASTAIYSCCHPELYNLLFHTERIKHLKKLKCVTFLSKWCQMGSFWIKRKLGLFPGLK